MTVVTVTIALLFTAFSPIMAANADPSGERDYNIPAQDLEVSLLAFSRMSGIDIVYDQALLRNHRSGPLKGVFAPPIAIAMLLHGSGLSHRFTSATAVLILRGGVTEQIGAHTSAPTSGAPQLTLDRLRVTAARMIGKPPVDYQAFGQVVRTTIMRRLQDNPSTQQKRFQARVAVQIDAQGVIRHPIMENGSGSSALDAEIIRILHYTTLPNPPPEGMPQPVWFEIVQR
jgi:hypothetical protein